jgi:hypothetical protein
VEFQQKRLPRKGRKVLNELKTLRRSSQKQVSEFLLILLSDVKQLSVGQGFGGGETKGEIQDRGGN